MRVKGTVDRAALRLAIKRRARPGGEGRILVVHGARGGSGASTLAANLAAALARHAGPVALVDLAVDSADQDLLWNLSCPLRVDDVLGPEGHELADAMVAHPRGVRLLAGPAGPAEAETLSAAAIRPLLLALSERHPYVVVDTSARLDEVTVSALEAATRIFVPLTPEMTSLRSTQRLLGVLGKLGLDLSDVQICMWDRPSELNAAAAARVLGRPVNWKLPWAPKAVQESINAGQPLALGLPRHPLAQRVGAIASWLSGSPTKADGAAPWKALLSWLLPKSERRLKVHDPAPIAFLPEAINRSVGLLRLDPTEPAREAASPKEPASRPLVS